MFSRLESNSKNRREQDSRADERQAASIDHSAVLVTVVDVATVSVAVVTATVAVAVAVTSAASASLRSATVVTVGTVTDSRLGLTGTSSVGVVVSRAVVGAGALLSSGNVVTLGGDSILSRDRAGDGLGSLSVNGLLCGFLGLSSTTSVESGGGENVVDLMDDTLLSDDIGLQDLGCEVADFDSTCLVVKDDILTGRRDHSSLFDEERRVEDSGGNNVLTKDGRNFGRIGLSSNEFVDSIVGGDKEGDTRHRVDSSCKSTVLNVGEQSGDTSVAEEAKSVGDRTRNSDSLADGLNGEGVELLAFAGESAVVDSLCDKLAVTRLGKGNCLTSTTGKLRKLAAVQKRVANGVQGVAVEVVSVKATTKDVLKQSSLKARRVGSDPRRKLGNSLVGGSEEELLRAVGKNAVGDGGVLREHVGKSSKVVVTKTLENGVSITALAELKVLELSCVRRSNKREERRDCQSELHD